MSDSHDFDSQERRVITVRGIVQGVGFRPFVYNLAREKSLTGFVKNQSGIVNIEVEGSAVHLNQFLDTLENHPPPLAVIEELQCQTVPIKQDNEFQILKSETSEELLFFSPDMATCSACLAELFNPQDRRYRYPFLNCTHCGPRLTITHSAPYDRERTSMDSFTMCEDCRREYEDPTNRRFHAQPIACPKCGPQLTLIDIDNAVKQLNDGQILAIKGLGGYHLCCSAQSEEVVERLRQRKHREEKPFAVLLRDIEQTRQYCEVNAQEEALLCSPRAPIVLLRKRKELALANAVAPGNPYLGVMLPYTPLHHLLAEPGLPLVLTSGNLTDEPIAFEDEDALQRLGQIADGFLIHNRPITIRCDDSVARVLGDEVTMLRRSRGYAPQPTTLPWELSESILAVGGQLKNTFALGRDRFVFLSHHLGDLDDYSAFQSFVHSVNHYQKLFNIRPKLIAHDLHPDYASTRFALEQFSDCTLIPIQHHHAHLASCMAEHGLTGRVLGVILDGTGFGIDQTIWGGEFLLGDYRQFERFAHLRPIPLPGGDRAIREPWRVALSYLLEAGLSSDELCPSIERQAVKVVEQMIQRRFQTPMTSSMGRLFDAVAALARVRQTVSFEGQAAIALEQLATDCQDTASYPYEIHGMSPGVIDFAPMICSIVEDRHRDVSAGVIGRRFHNTLVDVITDVCSQICHESSVDRIVLSGGCFMNALLTVEVSERLTQHGFTVYRQTRIPTNDGGLALGQLAIASHQHQ